MNDEVRESLERALPGYQVRAATRLGSGLDHVAYEVNGELIVRHSRETDHAARAELTRREAALLTAVRPWSTVAVPEVAFADEEHGVLAYRKLDGSPLLDRPGADPRPLAAAAGAFLSLLHRAPVTTMAALAPIDDEPLTGWLDDARRAYGAVSARLPATARTRVEAFLSAAPPPEPDDAVFCHADLGAEHLLVDAEARTITGVIDWADAAIADPARDLAKLYRDLGPQAFDVVLATYDHPVDDADLARARFYARCALIEDVEYGLDTGDHRYVEAALTHVSPTFA